MKFVNTRTHNSQRLVTLAFSFSFTLFQQDQEKKKKKSYQGPPFLAVHHSLRFWSFILLFLRLDFLVFLPFSLHICKRPKRQEALKISLWLKHFSVSPFSFFFFFLISYAATSIMLSSAGLSRIINSVSLKSIGKGVDYQSKGQLIKQRKLSKFIIFTNQIESFYIM